MSSTGQETQEQETVEEQTETVVEEPVLIPATELDDLFTEEDFELPDSESSTALEELDEEELRQRVVRAEKKAQFEREQRLTSAKKRWAEEAAKNFPYSRPNTITAESRRQFLEAAKQQDSDFRSAAAPILERVEKDREELKAELRAEVEAEMRQAWGKPTSTGGGAQGDLTQEKTDQRLKDARGRRDLKAAAKALMDGGRI